MGSWERWGQYPAGLVQEKLEGGMAEGAPGGIDLRELVSCQGEGEEGPRVCPWPRYR